MSTPQMKKIMFHEYKGPNESSVHVTNNNNSISRSCPVTTTTTRLDHIKHARSLKSATQPEVTYVTDDVTNNSALTAPLSTDVGTRAQQVRCHLGTERTIVKPEVDNKIADIWMPASSISSETVPSQVLGTSLTAQDIKQSDVFATDNTSDFTAFALVPSWCLSCSSGDAVSSSGPVRSDIHILDSNLSSRQCVDDCNTTLISASPDFSYSSHAMPIVISPDVHVTSRQWFADSEPADDNEHNELQSTVLWTTSPPMGSRSNCQQDVAVWNQPGNSYFTQFFCKTVIIINTI